MDNNIQPTRTLLDRARNKLPGGVNSPVRSFKGVGLDPLFAAQASGAFLSTTDGRRLIDFCMSFGPLILGHAHPAVVRAIAESASRGLSFAVTTEAEVELAELVSSAIPSMEVVRLVNSGTEAAMTAVRLARGFTGRSKILKFSGCYHGHADCMLVQAGSGVAGIAAASSAGVPQSFARDTLVAPYNDAAAAQALVNEFGSDLAAIIVEPIAANMGLVLPAPGFLAGLRSLCDSCGALLIFDEVITGFRCCFGGYQKICGTTPDLTCLGKIIGGGLPIGAFGARREIMSLLAPLGPVYQAGTLSGNPVSVAAGLSTLRLLHDLQPYAELEARTQQFTNKVVQQAHAAGLPLAAVCTASMFSLFFSAHAPECFADVQQCSEALFARFYRELLEAGVYFPPSPYEVSFLSAAHTEEVMEQAATAAVKALTAVK